MMKTRSESIENEKTTARIIWPDLYKGVLIKRYKRFLADIALDTGETITAHCPNSGSMRACSDSERPVYVSKHDSPKRKLKYTWELIDMPESLVGVNTGIPNKLVYRTIQKNGIPELAGYRTIISEIAVGDKTRLDLALYGAKGETCYIEIKNCTLVENNQAAFPDAVTTRGQKHLAELIKLKSAGHRSVIFFFVQRMDALVFRPCDEIDPEYGRMLREAVNSGVEILVYDVVIDPKTICIGKKLPFVL